MISLTSFQDLGKGIWYVLIYQLLYFVGFFKPIHIYMNVYNVTDYLQEESQEL